MCGCISMSVYVGMAVSLQCVLLCMFVCLCVFHMRIRASVAVYERWFIM